MEDSICDWSAHSQLGKLKGEGKKNLKQITIFYFFKYFFDSVIHTFVIDNRV